MRFELPETQRPGGLPTPDSWLIDPSKTKIETPVDERGLVKVDELIGVVLQTIEPDYVWDKTSNIHHLYWTAADYSHDKIEGHCYSPNLFRELPIHKAIIPTQFHNWLHVVTLPPPVPSDEVMIYRTDAYRTVHNLFRKVRKTRRYEKAVHRRRQRVAEGLVGLPEEFEGIDVIGEEIMQETLSRYFAGIDKHIKELKTVPSEFRVVDPDAPLKKLMSSVGRVAARPQLNFVTEITSSTKLFSESNDLDDLVA